MVNIFQIRILLYFTIKLIHKLEIVGKTVHSLKSQTNIKLGNTSIFCVRQGTHNAEEQDGDRFRWQFWKITKCAKKSLIITICPKCITVR